MESAKEEPGAGFDAPRPLAEIQRDFQKPIPLRLLETKTIDGNQLTYCPWYRVQKIVNHYTGGFWEYEVQDKTFTPKDMLITVRIYVIAAEGRFYREGTGLESLKSTGYGDYQSKAESMAFRRAAVRWGIGVDLYEGGGDE